MSIAATGITENSSQTLEVEIERLLPGGVGLAHAEGRTIFVTLAAPGDIVRVRIERTRGKVAFASVVEIVKPSPVRMEPPCPYFGRCGGCDFQQLSYESQLQTKLDIIRDCLHRIARIESPPEIQTYPSPDQWQYRARANWQFDADSKHLGYFERGSHRVCDVEFCAVLVPELQQVLETLRNEVRAGALGGASGEIDAVAGDDSVSVNPDFGILNGGVVSRKIAEETYRFDARTFFQINHILAGSLIQNAIGDLRGAVAVDLYCGVGLFTLPLARRFERVIGVESNRGAAEFARRNLEVAQLSNANIVTSRVADWIKHSHRPEKLDLLLLDPPRTGAEPQVIEKIAEWHPARISYVSCDPATLARDLKTLLAAGYSLDSVAAFDMFPQTHHVETVVWLTSFEDDVK